MKKTPGKAVACDIKAGRRPFVSEKLPFLQEEQLLRGFSAVKVIGYTRQISFHFATLSINRSCLSPFSTIAEGTFSKSKGKYYQPITPTFRTSPCLPCGWTTCRSFPLPPLNPKTPQPLQELNSRHRNIFLGQFTHTNSPHAPSALFAQAKMHFSVGSASLPPRKCRCRDWFA